MVGHDHTGVYQGRNDAGPGYAATLRAQVVVLTMASRRSGPAGGCGTLIGALLLIGLAILIITWALITVAILAVPFGIWWILDRSKRMRPAREAQRAAAVAAARRAEVESRAVVDAAGGCGWCGTRISHRDVRTGHVVPPREFHHDEVEQAIAITP
jgi:hypothetical protein